MFVKKWYCWVIGLTIIAAIITIPVAVYFALDASDACSTEDTSTCTATLGNCTNIESTWKCDCEEGYTNAAGDTQTCEDINECSTGDTSSCEADKGSCINMESTWRCECKEGYRNTVGNTQACEDVDECIDGDTSSCEAGKGNCMNMVSTWKCDCNDGYRNALGDPQTCEDVDECIDGDTSSCEAGKGNCMNMVSTWKCDCNDGYRNAVGDPQTCEDVNECIEWDTSSCEAGKGNCVNMVATWKCDCNDGYRNAEGDMQTCEDVDECVDGDTSSCEAGKGNCVNLDSTWKCDCNEGYGNAAGDMQTCEDIDECSTGDASSCHFGKGSCFNLEGTWRCDCNEGYSNTEGDTKTCTGPGLCETADTSSCDPARGSCVDTESSWTCQCLEGYVNFAGEDQTCEVDPCGMSTAFATEEGELEFPSGSLPKYRNNEDCTWTLVVPPGKVFILTFTEFSIQNHTECGLDYLELQDGFNEESPDTNKFCGEAKPGIDGVYMTKYNSIRLAFHSDDSETKTGFKLTWTSDVDECYNGDTTSCEAETGTCLNVESTWRCECNEEHENPIGDTQRCDIPMCGITTDFNTDEGELEFPVGDGLIYPHNANCAWTLSTTPDKMFVLTFTRFDIEETPHCEHDYLKIQHSSGQLQYAEEFCGTTEPGTDGVYTASDYNVLIEFRSQYGMGEGFKLTWHTVENPCGIEDTSSCEAGKGECVPLNTTWVCDCYDNHWHEDGDTKICEFTACGTDNEFTTTQGEIDFPVGGLIEYLPGLNCVWTLSTTPGKMLTFKFDIFGIEDAANCIYDYLEIQHGLSPESPVVDRLCGYELPGQYGFYSVYASDVRLVFISDNMAQFEGFRMTWTTVEDYCSGASTPSCEPSTGTCANSESTWVCGCIRGYENPIGDNKTCVVADCGNKTETSPGEGSLEYPGNGNLYYENDDFCIWILKAPPGKMLHLTFTKMDLEWHPSCFLDYLEVVDPSMNESSSLGRFCGDQLPGDDGLFITTLSELRLQFISNGGGYAEGFRLTWISVEDHCATANTTSCAPSSGTCQNLESTWFCGCARGYANPDGDIKTCVAAECGNRTQTSPGEGSLEFPGYGIPFYDDQDYCIWILTAAPGKVLTLTFSKINIEYHYHCIYDYLEVHDPSMGDSGLLGRFCGDQLPGDDGVFTTERNEILLLFLSDVMGNAEGFKLTWTSVVDYCAMADTTSCVPPSGRCQYSEPTWVCSCNRGYANPDGDIKTCVAAECGNKEQTSPGEGSLEFPGNGFLHYYDDEYCMWTLTAPPGKVLTLIFSRMSIEWHYECQYDYLEIHDPSMGDSGLVDTLCGEQLPGDEGVVTTNLNEILLVFVSDDNTFLEGFTLTWTSE